MFAVTTNEVRVHMEAKIDVILEMSRNNSNAPQRELARPARRSALEEASNGKPPRTQETLSIGEVA